ncbi:MAG: AAA family ATPase [Pseudomonadota bacterium]
MARRKQSDPKLPAPYLLRVWLEPDEIPEPDAYPFVLPFLKRGFELAFDSRITVIVGENGVGKSTVIEGIAGLCGFDGAGGGNGYRAVDHSNAVETGGELLGEVLRAAWRPKVTNGWFFRAESFFSVARYLDEAAIASGNAPPDFLSYSHGEGFMRFFEERCGRPGIFFFDEPESALSPARQVEFLKLLRAMHASEKCQVIMATHSPILMALPEASLLHMSKYGLEPVTLEDTDHYRLWREFCISPLNFVEGMLAE